jgi:hypothetical protein
MSDKMIPAVTYVSAMALFRWIPPQPHKRYKTLRVNLFPKRAALGNPLSTESPGRHPVFPVQRAAMPSIHLNRKSKVKETSEAAMEEPAGTPGTVLVKAQFLQWAD